jgi:C4-dicarboxylate-specific signal transduction histidine kinase
VQIWVNIIKNACEALQNSGQKNAAVRVKSRKTEGKAVVEIIDNGPGIPPDLLPRIFQPDVTTKVEGLSFGLGLGLSIVQSIIENMGGNIAVESEPGRTAFVVELRVEG